MQVDTSVALMNNNYTKTIDTNSKNDALLKEQTDKFEAFFIKQVLDISMKNDSKLFPKMQAIRFIVPCITIR